MPDVGRADGFSETLRIARLAAAHAVQVSPHVVHELPLHVVGAAANGFLDEFIDWTPPDLFEGLSAMRGRPLPRPRPARARDRARPQQAGEVRPALSRRRSKAPETRPRPPGGLLDRRAGWALRLPRDGAV